PQGGVDAHSSFPGVYSSLGTALALGIGQHWRPAARSLWRSPAAASPTIEGATMRKLISLTIMGVVARGRGGGVTGGSEEAGRKTTQVTTAPDGSKTKETIEHKVQTSGESPPAPASKP